MPANATPTYVGLDIGKDELQHSITDTEEGAFPTTDEAIKTFITRLRQLTAPRVICEASGGYEKRIVAELLAAGIEVCVVQPTRVRCFATAEGLMAKTDRIDARLLRRFGIALNPRLAVPTDPAAATLRELIEHRKQLVTQQVEVNGRLELAGKTLAKLLRSQAKFLKEQIEKVDAMIDKQIDNDPDLKAKSERLQKIKGVGPVLAATTLAYVPELGKIGDDQIASLIGVAPYPKDSSKHKGKRRIRGGRQQVRDVLYMAATSASQHNRVLSKFYDRLDAKGKPHLVCLTAVMRKLVCLMNRLIADPDFVLAD
jgi:transposase